MHDRKQGGHQGDAWALMQRLREWARELGFSQIGVTGIDLADAEAGLLAWLAAGFHGNMGYMAAHGLKRARPGELRPGTLSVISARMDYLPREASADWAAAERQALSDPQRAVVSVYARGRDYHKVMRARLQALADRLAREVAPLGRRVFTDSAPVLEVELATRAGAFLNATEPGATVILGGRWASGAQELSLITETRVLALNAASGVEESETVGKSLSISSPRAKNARQNKVRKSVYRNSEKARLSF